MAYVSSLGVCFPTAQQAGEFFGASSFPFIQSGVLYSVQAVNEFAPTSVFMTISAYNIDGSFGGGYTVVSDFLPCNSSVLQAKTITEAFLIYQPTIRDIDALLVLLIAIPMFFYILSFSIRKIIDILEAL